MHIARAQFAVDEVGIDAAHLRADGRGFELVGNVDRDKVTVQQLDDFEIGERTRSQAEGPASTAAGANIAIVGEQEDGAIGIVRQFFGRKEIGRPTDEVQFALAAGGLQLVHFLFDAGHQLVVREEVFRGEGCENGHQDHRASAHGIHYRW